MTTLPQLIKEYIILKKIQMGAIVSGENNRFLYKLVILERRREGLPKINKYHLSQLVQLYNNTTRAFSSYEPPKAPESNTIYENPDAAVPIIKETVSAPLTERIKYGVLSAFSSMTLETRLQADRIGTFYNMFVASPTRDSPAVQAAVQTATQPAVQKEYKFEHSYQPATGLAKA